MNLRRSVWILACALSVELVPGAAGAQGTAADYQRANGLRERYQDVAAGMPDSATWIGRTSRFWYRRSAKGGYEFVLVDADTQQKRPAFDHEKLAASLSKLAGRPYTAQTLPFTSLSFRDGENAIEVRFDGSTWTCKLADYACAKTDLTGAFERRQPSPPCTPPQADDKPRVSPDGKWEAFTSNYNVVIRAPGAKTWTLLSTDGSEGNCYEPDTIQWAPDSKKLVAIRVMPGYRRMVHYVESSPEDQLQPKHSSRFYAKPGDVLDLDQPVLFHVDPKTQLIVDNALFLNPYDLTRPQWRKDSSAFSFEFNQRGHQVYRVIEVDAETAKARSVITEESQTFFCYSGKKYRRDIGDAGHEIIWMSERDGWNHLYLYDGITGAVKNQITKGPWVVRGVSRVDEEKRQIYFSASGMYPGKDPYFVHFYRINFDGSGLTALTEADANHSVSFSGDATFYVDHYSRVDLPPVSELHRTADASLVAVIDRGDATALVKAGWRAPEVFTGVARDGKTDIWGVIYRPTTFDPKKKYPVIENIYAGPQGSFVPKSFAAFNAMQAQAELGFIVVQIDGMGTSNRSKAFHDVAWKNLGDAGFPDRILWHKAVAAKYASYDITRVGIYGSSAGGQNSLGALLFHPEFYKAAVSAAGCHDNRMDKIWWNEQWMGWPIGPEYGASSNVDNAYRLQGDVLLVVGEMDTNVDPSSTMQVVNQLIKHNKPFDLLVIPGAGHGPGGAYGEHKRYDFFVQHLLGVVPPAWPLTEAPKAPASGRRD
ncbi:MAG: DPP IV N-terminal domain-containing protein [Acidobacteria bacterium]|nr:DPP IV N-terminal domain-containing protein [Acidobacteriota bacterium]